MGNKKINIAIDGPAGAGKSTVARLVAKSLNYIYVDTGAMYRAITLKAIEAGLQPDQTDGIVHLIEGLNIELIPLNSGQQVIVNGEDISVQIRSSQVNQQVSAIAQIEKVREFLVSKQKRMALSKGVVMDGRDIATHVLPDAELKIYLTASVEERARRRYAEMTDHSITLQELEQEISVRDAMDQQREVSPLVVAEDAIILDGTHLSITQVVETILNLCRTKWSGEQ